MPERVGSQSTPVADKNVALSFAESNVSVSGMVDTINGSLTLDNSIAIGATSSDIDISSSVGVRINPNTSIDEIRVTYPVYSSGITRLRVMRTNDDTVMGSTTGGPWSGGDTISISGLGLSTGTTYDVVYDAEGAVYNAGYNSISYPQTAPAVDVTTGVKGTGTNGNFYFNALTAPLSSGSATVEWGPPSDVYAWDTAVYTATPDSETIEVYVEEDQSGGWTEIAGPITRGASIDADPANDVRFRAEISRTDTSNDPTLDSIARRWKL